MICALWCLNSFELASLRAFHLIACSLLPWRQAKPPPRQRVVTAQNRLFAATNVSLTMSSTFRPGPVYFCLVAVLFFCFWVVFCPPVLVVWFFCFGCLSATFRCLRWGCVFCLFLSEMYIAGRFHKTTHIRNLLLRRDSFARNGGGGNNRLVWVVRAMFFEETSCAFLFFSKVKLLCVSSAIRISRGRNVDFLLVIVTLSCENVL